MTFHDKVVQVQSTLKAPKNQRNSFGKYNYRSCEDILEAVKPLLNDVGLTLMITDEIKEVGGLVFVEARAVLFDAEGRIETTAQAGVDPNRKGMDIAQSFGSSSSYARKYALNGLFLIDDTADSDATNKHSDNRKWLMKGSTEFTKAKAFLEGGGSVADIEKKYKLSAEVKGLLK
tara:strand:- start:248 stop:772 length:525 start_codon:yes stop_codon:yes gene_type:complete